MVTPFTNDPKHKVDSKTIVQTSNKDSDNIFLTMNFEKPNNPLFSHIKHFFQRSHLHTLLLGFQHSVTSMKLPNKLLTQHIPKFFNITTMETKHLIDILSQMNIGPTRKFEAFLTSLSSQIKLIPHHLDLLNLSQLTNSSDCTTTQFCESSAIIRNLSSQSILYGAQVANSPLMRKNSANLNPVASRSSLNGSYEEIEHGSSWQFLICQSLFETVQQQLDILFAFVEFFYKFVPAQFTNFYRDFLKYQQNSNLCSADNEKLSKEDLINHYINRCTNFILQTANERIRQASNAIYQHIELMVKDGDNILIFSPSHLITKGIIYANLCGKRLNVTIADTHHKHSQDQFKQFIQHDIKCKYVLLTQLPFLLKTQHYQKCLFGAYSISKNGNILSRAGAQTLTIFTQQFKIPTIACAESYKFDTREEHLIEPTLITMLYGENDVEVEVVKNDMVSAILCEIGLITCQSIWMSASDTPP